MAPHRVFTEDEIAHALAVLRSNNGNAKRTAKHLGISRTTLRQWAGLSPVQGKQVPAEVVQVAALKLADTLEAISQKGSELVLAALGHVPIETATDVRNMLVGIGITTEKASFARGGPTNRSESLRISLVSPLALRGPELKIIESRPVLSRTVTVQEESEDAR